MEVVRGYVRMDFMLLENVIKLWRFGELLFQYMIDILFITIFS